MSERPVLEVDDLVVSFRLPRTGLMPAGRLRAVDGVSLQIAKGETLGLVGESGSGKSTVGRAILRLIEADSGSVRLDGRDVLAMKRSEINELRREMQMVFQDPYSSLNPSIDIATSVGEPLEVHEGVRGAERDRRVTELLDVVGLRPEHLRRYPQEFSGGQRQRLAIARAVSLRPSLIICDEPVSALDVSTQNQIINLLEDLQESYGLAYLFIAHDLAVVRHLADRVAVMYLGQIVETGPVDRVFEQPAHPYTLGLLSAVPIPNPRLERSRTRIMLSGDMPDAADPPSGCRFHTRCPWVMDVCRVETPPNVEVTGGGTAACHLHTTGPRLAGASVRELPLPSPPSTRSVERASRSDRPAVLPESHESAVESAAGTAARRST